MQPGESHRPEHELPTMVDGSAAVRTPSDPGSSSLSSQPDSSGSEAPTLIEAGPVASPPRESSTGSISNQFLLFPGILLGQRYEILQSLGEGGMGAVYKARDREVNRTVALKVIRPELAGNSAVIERFKQELVLSHQVTHRNVVRIYDLGEANSLKFMTMEYVEGADLRTLMQQNKTFSAEESVEIMRQVCRALEAAHGVGVIHRDLKPQNIMRDNQGRVVVMDFGLARTLDGDGMTRSGAVVGTMEYMSPEQGLGKPLDERSDLFTVGLIFYELLTGKMPYKADSALASLLKRTQERAAPVSEHNGSIPRALSNIVAKCLEPDLRKRYQTVAEILTDLEGWQGKGAAASLGFRSIKPWGETLPWGLITSILAVLLLAAVGYVFRENIFPKSRTNVPAGPVVALAIVPFRNASGDPSMDWLGSSIAEMLTTDVGESASLRTISSDRLHQILRDLRISSDTTLDAETLGRLAEFSNADQVIWGQYAKFGDQIRIDATLQDLKQQRTLSLKAEARDQNALIPTIDNLAHSIQTSLALSSRAVKELRATAFTPSTKDVTALKCYDQGLQLARQGKHLEAVKQFEAATNQDPQFALAYSKLGQTYARLGYDNQAEQASRKAVELSDKLPPAEKYRITASFAQVVNDNQKAIQEFENLARVSPDDSEMLLSLAGLYKATGTFDRARDEYTKLLAQDPKYVDALVGLGQTETLSGHAQTGLEYLNRALTLAIQLGNAEGKASALDAIGFAYNELDKPEEALRNLQQGLEIRRTLADKRGIALNLNTMGRVQERLGKLDNAWASYNEALELRRSIGDKRGVGGTLINLGNLYEREGKYDQAVSFYKQSLQIQHDVGDPTYEAVCLNNIGGAYFDSGEYDDALTYLQQALQIREKLKIPSDISDTLHNLGEASWKSGRYDDALKYYLRALELLRSLGDKAGGAAESESMGTVFEEQGRYGAALKAKEDAFHTMQELNEQGYWMAFIRSGYGDALNLVGRGEEAQKHLQAALDLAQQLHNDPVIAQTLNFRGDHSFYTGDYSSAQKFYSQALQIASKTTNHYMILRSKLNVAKTAVKLGHTQMAIVALRPVAQEAERRRLKYLSTECSLYLGEALLNAKDYSPAQQELEVALHTSQDLGLKALQTNTEYLLARVLRATGGAGASAHQAEARRILEEIRQEASSDLILKRSDFAPIAALAP
jgi:serine/threonine protein kinase/tetratricopeptide (TPR) repeat protein